MSKKTKKQVQDNEPIILDIPEDEIWTYRVPGLAAPHINKPYKHYKLKKVIFTLVVLVAVSLSCYFSVRTVQNETFEYISLENNEYELSKFSNTGYITELDIDYLLSIEYDESNGDPETNYEIVKDTSKKITSVGEYALNGDEKIITINIGPDVTEIDGKAFYSCWNLECVYVDENNPNYCDVDGVLYNKDKTEIIFYPVNHDAYLCKKYGYTQYNEKGEWAELTAEDEEFENYKRDVLTYVLPSTVTKIGELSMNYAYLADVYIPEGVETIETLAFFKSTRLENVYSYKTEKLVGDTHFTSEDKLGEVYISLPERLKYIGSDAFSYNQAMTYVYIPESVTYIGHHAFWDTVYKDGGELKGVTKIDTALSEDEFKERVETGDQWKPQYDYLLFKKSIDTVYGVERQ